MSVFSVVRLSSSNFRTSPSSLTSPFSVWCVYVLCAVRPQTSYIYSNIILFFFFWSIWKRREIKMGMILTVLCCSTGTRHVRLIAALVLSGIQIEMWPQYFKSIWMIGAHKLMPPEASTNRSWIFCKRIEKKTKCRMKWKLWIVRDAADLCCDDVAGINKKIT